MNRNKIILILILAAALAGIVTATVILLYSPAKGQTDQNQLIQVSNISHKDLLSIDIIHDDNSMGIIRQGEEWVDSDGNGKVDNITCELIATNLCYVFSDSIVDTNPDSLEAYRLDEPVLTATLTLKDGSQVEYIFGRETADKTQVYFMVSGNDNVYTMLNENFMQIRSDISTIMDLSLPVIDTGNIKSVKYRYADMQESLIPSSKYQSGYMFEKTGIAVAQSLIEFIKSIPEKKLYASLYEDNENEYGFDKGNYIVLTDASGSSINIILGDKTQDNKHYCMVEGKEGIYLASEEITAFLNRETDYYFDTRLIPAAQDQIAKICIGGDDVEFVLENDENRYLLNGSAISQQRYDEYIESLLQIKGSEQLEETTKSNTVYSMVISLKNKEAINIQINEYIKGFYLLDYGKGNCLIIQADLIDSLIKI